MVFVGFGIKWVATWLKLRLPQLGLHGELEMITRRGFTPVRLEADSSKVKYMLTIAKKLTRCDSVPVSLQPCGAHQFFKGNLVEVY